MNKNQYVMLTRESIQDLLNNINDIENLNDSTMVELFKNGFSKTNKSGNTHQSEISDTIEEIYLWNYVELKTYGINHINHFINSLKKHLYITSPMDRNCLIVIEKFEEYKNIKGYSFYTKSTSICMGGNSRIPKSNIRIEILNKLQSLIGDCKDYDVY